MNDAESECTMYGLGTCRACCPDVIAAVAADNTYGNAGPAGGFPVICHLCNAMDQSVTIGLAPGTDPFYDAVRAHHLSRHCRFGASQARWQPFDVHVYFIRVEELKHSIRKKKAAGNSVEDAAPKPKLTPSAANYLEALRSEVSEGVETMRRKHAP